MRLRRLLPLVLLLASPVRAHAQEPVRPPPGLSLPADRLGAEPDRGPRLGLAPLRPSFRLPIPAWSTLAGPWRWSLPGRVVSPSLAGFPVRPPRDLSHLQVLPVRRSPRPGADTLLLGAGIPPVPRARSPGEDTTERAAGFRELELPEVVQQVADLGLQVEGRGELGGSWNRFRPCDPSLDVNCDPGPFPRLNPDIQFGVQVGGTITDRIHVDVDYDQRREFDAANNISVYYQGQPGEVLQRVEMGDVSIDLPASRYLTQGIPAGNFGFKASARVGALDIEAVGAQQKGDVATREFRLGGGGEAGLVQDQELVLDDADYVRGQFFFLVDPTQLEGWPHIDIMTLDRSAAPASVRPRADRLAVYRDEGVTMQRYTDQAQVGTFLADAVAAEGELRHSGLFNLLEPGQDYYIHSSGLWVALRAPLRDDEALAVAYVSETGEEVGDPNAEAIVPPLTPELRLIRGPHTIHQPGQPTWPWEMHQVYRLDSSTEVERSSLEVIISLGHLAGGETFEEYAGRPIPLLRLFGLDDDAPVDRVDMAHLFYPGAELEAVTPSGLRGTFLVFPTLEPFGAPPPVPSEGLSALETGLILGDNANEAIYDEPDPVVRHSSSRFRLNFRYRVRLEGLLSSFNLGAFGIRPGSERITVDDRLLVRGMDYVVDYDLGLVTLLDPEATLGGNPDAEIRASWEQKALFDVAPTTVLGLNAATPLGPYGTLNLVGMYQAEQSVVRRPQLGTAPGAVLLGGASGRLAFQADWLVSALDAVPFLTVDSVARLDVSGELAMSAADPNRGGATYLDDFEATEELSLSLDAAEWQLGSVPQDAAAFPMSAWPLTLDNAAELVWQDRYREGDREVGFLRPQEIDQQIAFVGARLAEPVLYMTMGGAGAAAPQWRSLTTVLSTTGMDLSRSEYIEFYAAPLAGPTGDATLVVDIGTVSEDAFYFDSTGDMRGIDSFGEVWGENVLDAEASLADREVWGPDSDRRGLWGQTCVAERVTPLPLGDPRANCTVLNGRPDTEDLNANGVLDALDGPAFRFVVPLGPSSPYLVRGEAATLTDFSLYRIPLRGPDAVPLGGATEATWRFVKHLRMTVLKPRAGEGTLALARVRIAGSRWTKRDLSGVLAGRVDDIPGTGAASANIRVGPVSQLTEGDGYRSPPGVQNEPQDPKSALGASGVEFNEKSLRLSWEALPAEERGEIYFRYAQQPRNFLEYREIRFWAVPISGSWGPEGDHELLFKLGTDPRNYYVYRTRLGLAAGSGGVQEVEWRPEHVLDVERWLALKAEAERRLVEGDGPLVLWDEDGRFGIVLEDRARAPNLAAIRELSLAVYNGGALASDGEVWIDELRLDAGSTDAGFAGRVSMDLNAGGVVSASASFGGRGGNFRQLDGARTYETVDDLVLNTTAELGRFVPPAWGLSMPVTVTYLRTDLEPIYLQGTDVRADRLPGLREAGSTRRRIGVSVRKTTPTDNPVASALIDGTTVWAGHTRASDATVTTTSRLNGLDGGIEVDRPVADVGFDIVPAFVETILRWLTPRRVERSPFFRRVADAELRITPERIGFSTAYLRQDASVWRYEEVLASPADLDVQPVRSPRRTLESGASLALRPLESLTARFDVVSGRDLLDPDRATPRSDVRQALDRAIDEVWGIGLGWERRRVFVTDAAFRPTIAHWVQPSVSWSSRFHQYRDPAHITEVGTAIGRVAQLQRSYNVDRRLAWGLVFDPAGALRATVLPPRPPGADTVAPADPAAESGFIGAVLTLIRPIKPVELSWTDEAGSRIDRGVGEPGLDYQVGLGGMRSLGRIGPDSAALALERDGFRVRSGVRLGDGVAIDLGYAETDERVQDLRAGPRTRTERSWPDIQLSWQDGPVPSWAERVLASWSASTGFVRTRHALRLGDEVLRIRSTDETVVPVEVRLGFPSGLAFSYIGSYTVGDGRDPTGFTGRNAMSHAVSLGGRFEPPPVLRPTVSQPVRVSFGYEYQEQDQSRVAASLIDTQDMTPFVDHINRRLHLTVSSLIAQVDVGVQLSYIDRRNFIGTRVGSSQLQLGLFGQFNVRAGTVGR